MFNPDEAAFMCWMFDQIERDEKAERQLREERYRPTYGAKENGINYDDYIPYDEF